MLICGNEHDSTPYKHELCITENVDICATLLGIDRTPRLPLREECLSLGMECVYNARGACQAAVIKEKNLYRDELQKEFHSVEEKLNRCRTLKYKNEKKCLDMLAELRVKLLENNVNGTCISYDCYTHEINRLLKINCKKRCGSISVNSVNDSPGPLQNQVEKSLASLNAEENSSDISSNAKEHKQNHRKVSKSRASQEHQMRRYTPSIETCCDRHFGSLVITSIPQTYVASQNSSKLFSRIISNEVIPSSINIVSAEILIISNETCTAIEIISSVPGNETSLFSKENKSKSRGFSKSDQGKKCHQKDERKDSTYQKMEKVSQAKTKTMVRKNSTAGTSLWTRPLTQNNQLLKNNSGRTQSCSMLNYYENPVPSRVNDNLFHLKFSSKLQKSVALEQGLYKEKDGRLFDNELLLFESYESREQNESLLLKNTKFVNTFDHSKKIKKKVSYLLKREVETTKKRSILDYFFNEEVLYSKIGQECSSIFPAIAPGTASTVRTVLCQKEIHNIFFKNQCPLSRQKLITWTLQGLESLAGLPIKKLIWKSQVRIDAESSTLCSQDLVPQSFLVFVSIIVLVQCASYCFLFALKHTFAF